MAFLAWLCSRLNTLGNNSSDSDEDYYGDDGIDMAKINREYQYFATEESKSLSEHRDNCVCIDCMTLLIKDNYLEHGRRASDFHKQIIKIYKI